MQSRLYPVDVICVCRADGHIRPLRMQVEDNNHNAHRVDIQQVIDQRQLRYAGIEAHIFLCRALWDKRPWLFELKYTIASHNWCLIEIEGSPNEEIF